MSFWKRRKDDSSSSAGWRSKGTRLLPLLGGLVLTALGLGLVRQRISALEADIRARTAPVDIVVAAVPIAAGTAFSTENLAKSAIPSSGSSGRHIPISAFRGLLGSTARCDIGQGEPVLSTDVAEGQGGGRFSESIPAGRRAVTVEADPASAFSGLIRAGDRVDIHCPGPADPRNPCWFRDVPVVAVNKHFKADAGGDDPADISAITVSLTPEEATRFAAAGGGEMRWFLRNPKDRSGRKPASGDGGTRERPVEIWKGGIREALSTLPPSEPPL